MVTVEERGGGEEGGRGRGDGPDARPAVWEAAHGHLRLRSDLGFKSRPLHPRLDLDQHLWLSLEDGTGTEAHDIDLESSRRGSIMSGSLQGDREVDNLSEKGCHKKICSRLGARRPASHQEKTRACHLISLHLSFLT